MDPFPPGFGVEARQPQAAAARRRHIAAFTGGSQGSTSINMAPPIYLSMAGRRLKWLVLMGASAFYLMNPGFGIVELLPDGLPIIGNLDESVAVLVLLRSLIEIGFIRHETVDRLLNLKPKYENAILGRGNRGEVERKP
jgi:hypothetical protein